MAKEEPARYIFVDRPLTLKGLKKADPQKLGEGLAALAKKNRGDLKPQHVVKAARDPKSVFHPHFEWDDAKAGEEYRLVQARTLIALIAIEPLEEEEDLERPPRAFHAFRNDGKTSYRSHREVRRVPSLSLGLYQEMVKELLAFERRYRMVNAVICDQIRGARQEAERVLKEMESRPAA